VFRVLDPPTDADVDRLREFGQVQGLRVSLQPGGADSVQRIFPVDDPSPLIYRLPESNVEIAFRPTDFVQINGAVNRRMVAAALRLLEVTDEHRVLDLFCGIGNFTLPLARVAGEVTGVEGERLQIEQARRNAGRNGIGNVDFAVADLFAIDGSEDWFGPCDRLLLDPARSGAIEIARRIDRLSPARIVYVSCHPATLARDAGCFVNEAGYRLAAAGIIDMFPHTAHVESIAVFER